MFITFKCGRDKLLTENRWSWRFWIQDDGITGSQTSLGRDPPVILEAQEALPQMSSHFSTCPVVRLNIATEESEGTSRRNLLMTSLLPICVLDGTSSGHFINVGESLCARDFRTTVWLYGSPVFENPVLCSIQPIFESKYIFHCKHS